MISQQSLQYLSSNTRGIPLSILPAVVNGWFYSLEKFFRKSLKLKLKEER